MTDLTGRVLERYYYSPYGQLEAVQYADTPDLDLDGDIDQDDEDMIGSGSDCWGPPSGVCLLADFNCDNTVDAADLTLMQKKRASLSGDMEMRRVPATSRSQLGNPFAHQGLQLDPEIGSYQNRARQYAPKLKRFMQRDPLALESRAGSGFQDGTSPYAYIRSSPPAYTDPYGLSVSCGSLTCDCGGLYISTPLYAGASLPEGIGCMTFPWRVSCAYASCVDIPDETLSHECGHVCDLWAPLIGPVVYTTGAILEPATGYTFVDGGLGGPRLWTIGPGPIPGGRRLTYDQAKAIAQSRSISARGGRLTYAQAQAIAQARSS